MMRPVRSRMYPSFMFVFRLMPDSARRSRAGCVLGVLEFENVADGGGIPIFPVACGNSPARQTTTNFPEAPNASRFDFVNDRKQLGREFRLGGFVRHLHCGHGLLRIW